MKLCSRQGMEEQIFTDDFLPDPNISYNWENTDKSLIDEEEVRNIKKIPINNKSLTEYLKIVIMDKYLLKNNEDIIKKMAQDVHKPTQKQLIKKMAFELESEDETIMSNFVDRKSKTKPFKMKIKLKDHNPDQETPKNKNSKPKSISLSLRKSANSIAKYINKSPVAPVNTEQKSIDSQEIPLGQKIDQIQSVKILETDSWHNILGPISDVSDNELPSQKKSTKEESPKANLFNTEQILQEIDNDNAHNTLSPMPSPMKEITSKQKSPHKTSPSKSTKHDPQKSSVYAIKKQLGFEAADLSFADISPLKKIPETGRKEDTSDSEIDVEDLKAIMNKKLVAVNTDKIQNESLSTEYNDSSDSDHGNQHKISLGSSDSECDNKMSKLTEVSSNFVKSQKQSSNESNNIKNPDKITQSSSDSDREYEKPQIVSSTQKPKTSDPLNTSFDLKPLVKKVKTENVQPISRFVKQEKVASSKLNVGLKQVHQNKPASKVKSNASSSDSDNPPSHCSDDEQSHVRKPVSRNNPSALVESLKKDHSSKKQMENVKTSIFVKPKTNNKQTKDNDNNKIQENISRSSKTTEDQKTGYMKSKVRVESSSEDSSDAELTKQLTTLNPKKVDNIYTDTSLESPTKTEKPKPSDSESADELENMGNNVKKDANHIKLNKKALEAIRKPSSSDSDSSSDEDSQNGQNIKPHTKQSLVVNREGKDSDNSSSSDSDSDATPKQSSAREIKVKESESKTGPKIEIKNLKPDPAILENRKKCMNSSSSDSDSDASSTVSNSRKSINVIKKQSSPDSESSDYENPAQTELRVDKNISGNPADARSADSKIPMNVIKTPSSSDSESANYEKPTLTRPTIDMSAKLVENRDLKNTNDASSSSDSDAKPEESKPRTPFNEIKKKSSSDSESSDHEKFTQISSKVEKNINQTSSSDSDTKSEESKPKVPLKVIKKQSSSDSESSDDEKSTQIRSKVEKFTSHISSSDSDTKPEESKPKIPLKVIKKQSSSDTESSDDEKQSETRPRVDKTMSTRPVEHTDMKNSIDSSSSDSDTKLEESKSRIRMQVTKNRNSSESSEDKKSMPTRSKRDTKNGINLMIGHRDMKNLCSLSSDSDSDNKPRLFTQRKSETIDKEINLDDKLTQKRKVKLVPKKLVDRDMENLGDSCSSDSDRKTKTVKSNLQTENFEDKKCELEPTQATFNNKDSSCDSESDLSSKNKSTAKKSKKIKSDDDSNAENSRKNKKSTKNIKQNEVSNPIKSEKIDETETTIYDNLKTLCEDDPLEDTSFSKTTGIVTSLEEFETTHPGLSEIKYQSSFNIDDLDSEDEICIIQCPKLINLENLVKQKIDLNIDSDLTIQNTNYKCSISKTAQKICLATTHMKTFNCQKFITISENLDQKIKKHKIKETSDKVQFPANLKIRHPLFGYKYEAELKLSDAVVGKLREAERVKHKSLKRELKRRKNPEKTKRSVEYDQFLGDFSNVLNTRKVSPKKDDKSIENLITVLKEDGVSKLENIKKKKKKTKKRKTEVSIEENEPMMVESNKRRAEVLDEEIVPMFAELKKKKTKKRKTEVSIEKNEPMMVESKKRKAEVLDEEIVPMFAELKKRKMYKSYEENASTSTSVSIEKQRKRRRSEGNIEDLCNEVAPPSKKKRHHCNIETPISTQSKKDKKKYQQTLSNISNDFNLFQIPTINNEIKKTPKHTSPINIIKKERTNRKNSESSADKSVDSGFELTDTEYKKSKKKKKSKDKEKTVEIKVEEDETKHKHRKKEAIISTEINIDAVNIKSESETRHKHRKSEQITLTESSKDLDKSHHKHKKSRKTM